MTDKLKCPWCDTELYDGVIGGEMFCGNDKCEFCQRSLPTKVWQDLVSGKKAQTALIEAVKCINWTTDTIYRGLDREADIVGCCELSLERINEITKQENK